MAGVGIIGAAAKAGSAAAPAASGIGLGTLSAALGPVGAVAGIGSAVLGFTSGKQAKKNQKKAARRQSSRNFLVNTTNTVQRIKQARQIQAQVVNQSRARGVGAESSGAQAQRSNVKAEGERIAFSARRDASLALQVASNLDSAAVNLSNQATFQTVSSLGFQAAQTFGAGTVSGNLATAGRAAVEGVQAVGRGLSSIFGPST